MFAKSSHSDSYDYFLKGDDGEFHRVGWATSDSIKPVDIDPSDDKVILSMENNGYEFTATAEVNPEFVKQMNDEMRQEAQNCIDLLDKVVDGLNCCIFGDREAETCRHCPYKDDHYSCRLHLFMTARNALYQYRKVYEQLLQKEN